jgi:DNA-binding LacI/PurR family transcriptional regulator
MKHPTMEDVARQAGVSRALVSLVLRSSPRVSDGSRHKVLAAAEQLGYRPNAMARGLASQRGTTIGVLLNDLHNPFFADIVDGIEDLADAEGFQLLLGHGGRPARELAVLGAILEFRPAGLVLLSPDAPSAVIAEQTGGLPAVVVGRPVRRPGMDTVMNDEAHGARLAVEHLARLGHRRIAHVSGGARGAGAKQRARGYEVAMRAVGLAEHTRVVAAGFTEQDGVDAARSILARGDPPSAIVAANDLVAVGMMAVLDDHGLAVPGDVSLVGYDNSALAHVRHVDLTTVNQPRHQMGRLALTCLLERIRGQRDRSVLHRTTPTLVVRSSTAPPS